MELFTGAAIKAAMSTATKEAIEASFKMNTSDWKLSNRVKSYAAERKVFGLHRRRKLYVRTPLIDAIQGVMMDSGIVYIAVVPSGEGKTTTANAFLHCFPSFKGIAVCSVGNAEVSYHQKLADELSLSSSKAGWMEIFLRSLHKAATSPSSSSPCLLILDEFIPGVSEDEQITDSIRVDLQFLIHIKSLISEWNICVIVLTPNTFAAALALGLNGLSGILPLPGLYAGVPRIVTRQNLKLGDVQWNETLWTEELLVDVVVLYYGTLFTRATIGSWIREHRFSKPNSVLRHAKRVANQLSLSNQNISAPCDAESLPPDLSAQVLVPPETPQPIFLGCIPWDPWHKDDLIPLVLADCWRKHH